MTTTALTSDTFEEVVTNNDIVIVDFWAAWCGPCRSFAPVFEAASEKHTDIIFAKVDTEAEQQLAAGFQITSIPTLMVFRENVIVFSQAGALPGPQLEQLIEGVRGLDMNEVRAQTAAQGAAQDAAQDAGERSDGAQV